MRADGEAFAQLNGATSREPRFVVEVDFGDNDLYYFTSNVVPGVPETLDFDGTGLLISISGTSQRLAPEKALSTIGALTFKVANGGLTALQYEKLEADKGLKGKRVRFYAGFAGLDFASFTLVQTQIIQEVSYKNAVYTFKCADIQREMRKDIFDLKETTLSQTLEADADTIKVHSTRGFSVVQQPDSPSGRTLAYIDQITNPDAPKIQKFGLLKVEAGEDYEIILYTAIEDDTFTGLRRGVLGTKPLRVEVTADADADNAPKVTEYVYLDMPAVMLAYAVLTGNLYGYPGETLPDHWHLGISTEYVRTAEFTGIGPDLWDLDNLDMGRIARFEGIGKQDGKKFVEEELFRMLSCFSPIYSDGQLGLRRMTVIPSSGGYVRLLDESSIISYGELKHDMQAVMNRIIVRWNWNERKEDYTRANVMLDPQSIDRHGEADIKEIEFRGLSGSRHSYADIKNIFDGLRDRYAGPPLRLTLELSPDNNDLEVGDVVRVYLPQVEDYTSPGGMLNRNFEIQQIKVDWKTGRVTVELFGSSQKASPLTPEVEGAAIPSAWYESQGTEISETNFPGSVTSAGGVTTITGGITLEGAEFLTHEDAIFYCTEDLVIASTATVTITKNVQLRVAGFFECNGQIDGRGNGPAGGAGVTTYTTGISSYPARSVWQAQNRGTPGYIGGTTLPQGGASITDLDGIYYFATFDDTPGRIETFAATTSQNDGDPKLDLTFGDDPLGGFPEGVLYGLPDNLQGSSGSGGGMLVRMDGQWIEDVVVPGGNGGAGGAGLCIICRGADLGENAVIDVSGGDAATPGSLMADGSYGPVYAGAGAPGGPGAVFFVIDGATNNPPSLLESNLKAEFGAVHFGGTREGDGFRESRHGGATYQFRRYPNQAISAPQGIQPAAENIWTTAFRVIPLTGTIEPSPDVDENTDSPSQIILAELTNTPRTASANLSTIEVTVTPPSASNYSYSLVEYREKGESGWFQVGPASPECSFVVPADGTTYEVQARGVSKSGVTNQSGVVAEIKTTNVRIPQPGEPPPEPEPEPEEEASPEVVVPAPNVRGLELFEQGNDTVFGGRDAKFVWRKSSVSEWFELGGEGIQGASSGGLDLYFKDYQVEIWADVSGTTRLVRTEWVADQQYTYTFEKNAEDYLRLHGQSGAWRAFECRVYCRGRQNQISPTAARLAVSNPAPALPAAIVVTPSIRSLQISFTAPDDLDYRHTRIWMSTAEGFTPSAATLAAQVDGSAVIDGLEPATTYYLRVACFDAFGQGVMSDEFAATTVQITNDDVGDGQINLQTKVTGQLQGDNIADGAVVNVTEVTASPGTQIFDGTDNGIWKTVATMDVTVLGSGSALLLNFHLSFDLDQVTEAWGQAGPGGPLIELRVRRDGLTVWNPDPIMVSGSGRAALQFGSKTDTGMPQGLSTYEVQLRWSKGTYDAGTVDYPVYWNSNGEAYIRAFPHPSGTLEGLTFNGAFPATYMGEGWEVAFPGTGGGPDDVIRLAGTPSIDTAHLGSAGGITWTAGWLDWRTFRGIIPAGMPRAPALDRAPQPQGFGEYFGQPYTAVNNRHKVIGSLVYYEIRATEYRG